MRTIVIAGGSGHLGTILSQHFQKRGDRVVILSRGRESYGAARVVRWDGRTLGAWTDEIERADAVINLAGRSVNCRYTPENRDEIMRSRIDSTRILGAAIAAVKHPPRVWLQMSTATIYAHRYDAPNDEREGILGGSEPDVPETWKFSIDVARAWEETFDNVITPRTRKVKMRSAIVMAPQPGGPFDFLARLVRFRLGGSAGDGRQFVSWIHDADFARAVEWLIERDDVSGTINLASPNPLPQKKLMRALRDACAVRIGLPATPWMLEIGAAFLRTETELILKSRRVVSSVLAEKGFRFQYPEWQAAAMDLHGRMRQEQWI